MESNKPFWTIIMLFVNLFAMTYLVFQMKGFLWGIAVVLGLIIIAVLAVGGLVQKKNWSVNLLSFLYSAILLNVIYLFFRGRMGYLLVTAFTSAVVGFLIVVSIKIRKPLKKSPIKTYSVAKKRPQKQAAKKTTVKKKVVKKKVVKKKKKAAKKKAKK